MMDAGESALRFISGHAPTVAVVMVESAKKGTHMIGSIPAGLAMACAFVLERPRFTRPDSVDEDSAAGTGGHTHGDAPRSSPSLVRLPSLEAARDSWTELADQQDNVFATWEWASSWWRTYGKRHELFVHQVLDEDGRPIGILPLYIASTRFGRLMRLIGNGPADQLGPVCRAEHRQPVATALLALISAPDSPGILLAERMRTDEHWGDMLGGRHIRHESFSLIDLEGLDWDEWLETRSANFRQHVRKGERRLARDHRLEYRLVTDEEEVLGALDTLITLHNARWEGDSSAFGPSRRAFHEDFARAAARRGWLRIRLATVDGEPAAAWLGYRFGGAASSYLMGRSPAWSKYNVGSVLRMHAIREVAEEVREFRLLGGNEPYKQRLTTLNPGVDTFLVGSGPLPWMAHAVIRHKHRLPGRVRGLLAAQLGW